MTWQSQSEICDFEFIWKLEFASCDLTNCDFEFIWKLEFVVWDFRTTLKSRTTYTVLLQQSPVTLASSFFPLEKSNRTLVMVYPVPKALLTKKMLLL